MRIKILKSGSGLQVLAMLLCLAQLSRHICIKLPELQDLLLMLLAVLGMALDIGLDGPDLITEAALIILALVELSL